MTDTYQDRKIAGLCTRCGDPAEDGCQLCPKHRAAQKRYAKACYTSARDARRKAKACVRCGGKRKPGSKWCVACLIKRGKVKTKGLKQGQNIGRDRIAARTDHVTEGDGRTRSRFRGRGAASGRMSNEEKTDADLRDAVEALRKCEAGLVLSRSPEVAALPPIQRKEALLAALSHADHARRFLVDLLERHKYPTERE